GHAQRASTVPCSARAIQYTSSMGWAAGGSATLFRKSWEAEMLRRCLILAALVVTLGLGGPVWAQEKKFEVVEATIADIQNAIRAKQITATDLVTMYLTRIKAYNGTCVQEPQGILGPVSPIAHAGDINALMTLNLRPPARKKWGFDDRKARSLTD